MFERVYEFTFSPFFISPPPPSLSAINSEPVWHEWKGGMARADVDVFFSIFSFIFTNLFSETLIKWYLNGLCNRRADWNWLQSFSLRSLRACVCVCAAACASCKLCKYTDAYAARCLRETVDAFEFIDIIHWLVGLDDLKIRSLSTNNNNNLLVQHMMPSLLLAVYSQREWCRTTMHMHGTPVPPNVSTHQVIVAS